MYVFDSRRPVNLSNVHVGGANVDSPKYVLGGSLGNVVACVLGECEQGGYECISDGEGCDEEESDEEEEEESDSDEDGASNSDSDEENAIDYTGEGDEEEEADFGDVEGSNELSKNSKRRRLEELTEAEEGGEEGGEEGEDDGEDDGVASSPNPNDADEAADDDNDAENDAENDADDAAAKAPLDPVAYMEERKHRILAYYSAGTSHSKPTSYVLYQLVLATRSRDEARHLWTCIVGCTAEMLGGNISAQQYNSLQLR